MLKVHIKSVWEKNEESLLVIRYNVNLYYNKYVDSHNHRACCTWGRAAMGWGNDWALPPAHPRVRSRCADPLLCPSLRKYRPRHWHGWHWRAPDGNICDQRKWNNQIQYGVLIHLLAVLAAMLPVRQYSLFSSSLPLRCGVHFLNFPLHDSENRCVEVDWNAYGYGNSDIWHLLFSGLMDVSNAL